MPIISTETDLTIGEALLQATRALMGKTGSPRLDAQLILGHIIERPREYLIAHSEAPLAHLDAQIFEKLLTLRTKGMPIAYILGKRPFYDRTFLVTSHVLIPRPETEHLVEAALEWVTTKLNGEGRIVDVGTGSGVIGVTLAAHLPKARVYATDVSAAALGIAQENGRDLSNLKFVQSDLLSALRGPFDVIAANLPYIATEDMQVLEVAAFEPHVALDGGPDGLVLIRRLLTQAPARLSRPGLMLLEIGADQGAMALAAAQATFAAEPDTSVQVLKDYGGLDRVVRIERPGV